MEIKTQDRLDVIEALLNDCMKDGTIYCNNCDNNYDERFFPCCENPQIGTNSSITRALIIENEYKKKSLHKDTGASKEGNMRIAFSLPPRVYSLIKGYFSRYNEPFPLDKEELHRMMRKFNKFTVANKI